VVFKDGVMTLQDVSPATVFFSDRPQRIVGHVRNDLFLKQWTEGKNSFKNDPPNAVLSIFSEKGRPTGAVVVLNNPRLEGKNLLYDAQSLRGTLPTTGAESTPLSTAAVRPASHTKTMGMRAIRAGRRTPLRITSQA
jgi:hypothetical protein